MIKNLVLTNKKIMIKKNAKVLLVAPNMVGMSDGLNRIQPSLGLMLIASCLLDDGHDVKIHDTGLAGWNNRRVIDPIKDPINYTNPANYRAKTRNCIKSNMRV